MLPLRTILFPTDLSEPSSFALPVARALARDHGARVVALYVAAPPAVAAIDGVMLPSDDGGLLDQARRHLDQLDLGANADRRAVEGDPVTEILRVAEEARADLIVMGTHGRTGLGRLVMGSVAEQVLRRAPCPVLTLKAPIAVSPSRAGEPAAEPTRQALLVRDVMTRGAECVRPDDSLQYAAERMKGLEIGALPVCENDRVVGMLTDRDITVRSTSAGALPARAHVRDVMTPDIVYCFDDQSPAEAAQLMKEHQVRRLAVMNRDRRLVGIVSLGDLAVETGDERLAGRTLEEVSEPNRPNR